MRGKVMMKRGLASLFVGAILSIALLSGVGAQSNPDGFSLQVSPSPIIETITPGQPKEIDLRIKNNGSASENLKMGLQSFSIDSETDAVNLEDQEPQGIADWVSFQNPTFTVGAGEWYVQKITFRTPADAGFSYSFAITISRQQESSTTNASNIQGSVAVFTLLNVNKPGATKQLSIAEVSVSKRVYEYLPATISISLENTGNTLIQPKGTVFIQRSADDSSPLAALPLNDKGSYILPNSSRTLTVQWADGFPVYEQTTNTNGETATKLVWNWQNADAFRIGKYTAKVVAVYDDGERDVPLEATISFWVIPWKLIILAIGIVSLLIIGIVTIIKKLIQIVNRKKHAKTPSTL